MPKGSGGEYRHSGTYNGQTIETPEGEGILIGIYQRATLVDEFE